VIPSSFDVPIRASRVVDSAGSRDEPAAVVVCGDRIVAVGPDATGHAPVTQEFPAALLPPTRRVRAGRLGRRRMLGPEDAAAAGKVRAKSPKVVAEGPRRV
jgi:hypothetical protein